MVKQLISRVRSRLEMIPFGMVAIVCLQVVTLGAVVVQPAPSTSRASISVKSSPVASSVRREPELQKAVAILENTLAMVPGVEKSGCTTCALGGVLQQLARATKEVETLRLRKGREKAKEESSGQMPASKSLPVQTASGVPIQHSPGVR